MKIPFLFAVLQPKALLCVISLAALVACAGPGADGVNDPLEPANRVVHGLNKGLDTVIVRPVSKPYGALVPDPVERGVNNVGKLLDQPSDAVNHLLQGDLEGAAVNVLRFGSNLVFGLGGLLDVATEAGLPEAKTDFGQTLHVWGVGEGPYVELPIIGPSTARDAVGEVVDIVLDPVGQVAKGKDATAVTVIEILSRLGDRSRYSGTIDGILYDSADSYVQARLLYLQNRRFELGQSASGGAASADPDAGFIDPYEDPYAE